MLRKLLFLSALVMFPSLSALAQETQAGDVGYTYCPTGQAYVYLYRSLSNFEVSANLKCGEKVEILGRENLFGGYLRVRTADGEQGYVSQSDITATPPANPRQQPAPAATSTGDLGRSLAFGQGVPRAEIFGGYSYLNVDTNGLTSRQSFNGWESSVSGNFNKWLAAEANVSGYYKTYNVDLGSLLPGAVLNVSVHDYGFLGGPRINVRPVFFHALLGVDRLTASALGFSASQNSFAAAFGGGGQWKVSPQWAVRTSADYVLTRHNTFGGPRVTQNNIRVSAGVVFRFGRVVRR